MKRQAVPIHQISFTYRPGGSTKGELPVVKLDSLNRTFDPRDDAICSIAQDRGDTTVQADVESPYDSITRQQQEERERGKKFDEWAKNLDPTLLLVKISPKRWIVGQMNSWTNKLRGVAYRGVEHRYGPATEQECREWIVRNGPLIPLGIPGHDPLHPDHENGT